MEVKTMAPDTFGPKPPRKIKPWEKPGGKVIANPNFVSLAENKSWKPTKYVSYLWVLPSQDNLFVGVETQVLTEHAVKGVPSTNQMYGHPTLTGGAAALYGGELLYKPSLGSASGWIINGASGRYGRSKISPLNSAYLRLAQSLFYRLIGLYVNISSYEVRDG